MRKKHTSSGKLLWLSRFFGLAAAMILMTGILVTWSQHKANKSADKTARQQISSGHISTPSTTRPAPSAFDSYTVPGDSPRYIFIPKLSVRAMVKPLGLTVDNRLASPSNVFDAGWYNQSAKPGQPGATVVDGHVSSWTTRGVFYGLKDLKPDDTIQVERGDGTMYTYKVTRSQVYDADKVDMDALLSPINSNKPGLNLITCDGNVTKGTNEFNKRIVVFTELI